MKEGEVRKRNRIFCLSIFFSAVYLFWRLVCTLPWGEGIFQVLAGLLLLLAETVTASARRKVVVLALYCPIGRAPSRSGEGPGGTPR